MNKNKGRSLAFKDNIWVSYLKIIENTGPNKSVLYLKTKQTHLNL